MNLNTNWSWSLSIVFFLYGVGVLQAQQLPIALKKQLENFDSTLTQEKLYIHTDRTYYKPGDNIWFSVYLLNQKLERSTKSKFVRVELINPLGNVYKSIFLQCSDTGAIVAGDFHIDEESNGGFFKIRAYTRWMERLGEIDVVEKEINVQPVVYSNLLLKLDFDKNSYGSGSKVEAELTINTLYNEALANKKLTYTISLDGKKWVTNSLLTDKKGKALVQFQLPSKLKSSDALLSFKIVHEDVAESISRSIPLLLNNIDLQFLPEGGHYISQMDQKIAFKVLDEFGQPADVEGLIFADEDTLCSFQSYHDGMGTFELLKADYTKNYTAKITSPQGIDKIYPIAIQTNEKNIGLRLTQQQKDRLEVNIYTAKEQQLWLTVQMQGAFQYEQAVECKAGSNLVSFPIDKMPVGIAQISVFDKKLQPHAERLVFVNKHKQLHINIKSNKKKYLPREQVKLDISVNDQDSIPVQGVFSLAVVNEKNISLADDKQANILAQILLNSDLKGAIHEPNFYFDREEEKADQALDHVLLTHGWRRFEWPTILEQNRKDWIAQLKKIDDQNRIKGIAYVNGIPLTNHQIVLSKEGNDKELMYSKKEAQAISRTNNQGEFEFTGPELAFPTYLSTQYRGIKTNAFIESAQTGTYKSELIQSEDGLSLARIQSNVPSQPGRSSFGRGSRSNRRNSNGRTGVSYGDGYNFEGNTSTYVYRSGLLGTSGLSGRVVNSASKEEVIYANIILIQNNEIKYGTTTDFDGQYQFFDVAPGAYTLKISYIGYENFTLDLILEKERSSIVEINLGEQAVLLAASSLEDPLGRPRIITVTAESYNMVDAGSMASMMSIERSMLTNRPVSDFQIKGEISLLETSSSRAPIARRLPKAVVYKQKKGVQTSYGNRYNFIAAPYSWQALADIQFQISEVKALTIYKTRTFYSPKYSSTVTRYRTDFRETIYWNPQVSTNAKGKAQVTFYCSDEISTFRATIEGVGNGSVGTKELLFYAQNLLEIKTKVPTKVIQQDSLIIPVVIKNNTEKEVEGVFTVQLNRRYLNLFRKEISIPADSFLTIYLNLSIDYIKSKKGLLEFKFKGDNFSERSVHQFEILPSGFPVEYAMSGNTAEKEISFEIHDAVPRSIKARFYASPNPLDDLTESIAGIMREPTGCFEQTSSKNYPNILALQYMETTGNIDAERRSNALRLMKKGYAKLTSYETLTGGFSLYGRVPGSLKMSAYGLLQFKDMQSVYDGVSPQMMQRIKGWILEKENYQHCFSENKTSNAYVVYALSQMESKGIENALLLATQEAASSKDLYRLGLMLLANLNYNNKKEVKALWEMYHQKITEQALGKASAEGTIVGSRGNALNITLVSMGVVSLMKMKKYKDPFLGRAISFIASQKKFSKYGNTQSTVWAIKALAAYGKVFKKKGLEGEYKLVINGQTVQRFKYSGSKNRQISLAGLEKYLKKGKNKIKVLCENRKGEIPTYSFDTEWCDRYRATDTSCQVALKTSLAKTEVQLGETIRLTAHLHNKTNQAQASTVAVIGIPCGLSLQAWQLKELQDKNKVDYIELMDEYIVLHYKDLAPNEAHVIHLDLKTEFGGTFYAPASTAYLYYHDELKDWTNGTTIQIRL